MFISRELLDQFIANRAARYAFQVVGDNDEVMGLLKTQRTKLWAAVHEAYGIPSDLKLKLELDGDLVGQLRTKNGQPYMPSGATCGSSACSSATSVSKITHVVLNSDGTATGFTSLDEARDYTMDTDGGRICQLTN